MSSVQEWFVQKLQELQIKEDKVEILNEIKIRLDPTTPFEVTSNFLTQPQIFDCAFEEKSKEQTQLACDILALCLSTLDINRTDYSKHLIKSLKHRNPRIRSIALDEIYKNLTKNSTASTPVDNISGGVVPNNTRAALPSSSQTPPPKLDQELILQIIKLLENDETEVAGPAIKILSIVLQHQMVGNSQITAEFKSKLDEKDIIKVRVYEITVNLVKSKPSLLGPLQDVLDRMLNELSSDDILFQMNLLELLTSLAEQNHGFTFMEEKRVFDNLAIKIQNIEMDPLLQLLAPGFMKFFGKIAVYQPKKILEGYPNIILYLFNSFNQIDMNMLPVALDTIGNLASSAEGKIILDERFDVQMRKIFEEEYSGLLRNLPTDLKCRVFTSLQMIFMNEGNSPPNNRIELITKKWCTYLVNSDYDLGNLMDYCKNPFPDIKISCLKFIKTICSYLWGIESVKNTAGLMELLMNRAIEFNKDVKYEKFEIISILSESNQFDGSQLLQLKRYIAEGPYFVEPIMEIAVE